MEKKVFRSLVKNSLRKYDLNAQYHDAVIDGAIDSALKSVIYSLYKNNPDDLSDYVYQYTTQASVLSGHDGVYSIDLPYDYISLPDKRSGVRAIRALEASGLTSINFFPLSSTEAELLNSTDFNLVGFANESAVGYVVNSNRVLLYGVDKNAAVETAIKATGSLELDLLRSWNSYTDDDDIRLPFGANENIYSLIINFLNIIPPVTTEDKFNDAWQSKTQLPQ